MLLSPEIPSRQFGQYSICYSYSIGAQSHHEIKKNSLQPKVIIAFGYFYCHLDISGNSSELLEHFKRKPLQPSLWIKSLSPYQRPLISRNTAYSHPLHERRARPWLLCNTNPCPHGPRIHPDLFSGKLKPYPFRQMDTAMSWLARMRRWQCNAPGNEADYNCIIPCTASVSNERRFF